jgi:large repetitive protein
MRAALLVCIVAACGGSPGNNDTTDAVCSDGIDNDADGLTDFPDDLGCVSPADDTEDSPTSPACSDGRDNDGDGKVDFPDDPGCFGTGADNEADDCPDGPNCPQCSNGRDDDMNGQTDFPEDPGCEGPGDTTEFVNNPVACGAGLTVKILPPDGRDRGTFGTDSTSQIMSPCGGGFGSPAVAYVLQLTSPMVVTASTMDDETLTDTVLDIRGSNCEAPDAELGCNDDYDGTQASYLVKSLPAGIYYLIVSGRDPSTFGDYVLEVQLFTGEGAACAEADECGPGLVCRTPLGGTMDVCAAPVCSDGLDDDGDGTIDFPDDPGCVSETDETEDDDCPTGPNCPQCSNGVDDDTDQQTDYPNDTSCLAASGSSESCLTSEGVAALTQPVTTGTTTGATNDFTPTCGSSSHSAGDKAYAITVPALDSLIFDLDSSPFFDAVTNVLGATCANPAMTCSDSDTITMTNVAAGQYFYIVDGYSSATGNYTINVRGTIKPNESCESPLALSGALVCGGNTVCKGMPGQRRCQPPACSDNVDNNGNTVKDFPQDPGCTSPLDDDEATVCPGAGCPVCSNGMDDDTDTTTDFPGDIGCRAASQSTENFCVGEPDYGGLITTAAISSTLAGRADNYEQSCQATTGRDMAFDLILPVNVVSLRIDTIGSTVADTVVSLKNHACSTELGCDDDSDPAGFLSLLTVSNVPAGSYTIQVDAYSGGIDPLANEGAFTLNVRGTVAAGAACTSPLFATGVLACPVGQSCTAGTCQ